VSWESPEDRHGRTAVLLLVAAILVATALAIALVAGAASQSSGTSDDVLVHGARVTNDTSTTTAEVPAGATATISVPEIELNAAVYEGVAASVLDIGPGHWPGTAAPGGNGNLVITGHRSTSARYFERIGELVPGDPIVVGDATGTYTYVVDGSDVVATDFLDAVAPAPGHIATLIAPHPPGSEQYRYVVRARLVSTPRPPGA
jgi:LPXTG-site transpeptidase (sortase) family protein